MAAFTPHDPERFRWVGILAGAWVVSVVVNGVAAYFHFFPCFMMVTVLGSPVVLFHAALRMVPKRRNAYWVIPSMFTVVFAANWLGEGIVVAAEAHRFSSLIHWVCGGMGWENDGWILSASIIGIAGALFWLTWPRKKAEGSVAIRCSQCGYDLHGSLHAQRCPECGKVLEMGKDIPDLEERARLLRSLEAATRPPKTEK